MLKGIWLKLFALNCIAFLFQHVYPWFTGVFALVPAVALDCPWMFFTSMFLHANFEHILYNMFALVFFGIFAEHVIGSRKFLFVYVVSGLVASVASFYFYSDSVSLGASGAIYGLIGLMTMLRPRMVVWWGAPIPMILFGGLYIFMDLVGVFAPLNPDNVAYMAHIVGFAVGVVFALRWKDELTEEKMIGVKTNRELEEEKIIDKELDAWEEKFMV